MYTDDHEGVFGMDPGLELDLDEGLDFLDVDDDEDMPSLGVYPQGPLQCGRARPLKCHPVTGKELPPPRSSGWGWGILQ